MRRSFSLMAILAVFAAPTYAADCLHVNDQRFELSNEDISGADIQWQAEIENRCDLAFDALLTLHFMTPDGESLYWAEVTDIVDVQEHKTLSKQLLVPGRVAEQFETIDIEVEERERPL